MMTLRKNNIAQLQHDVLDVLIIGGGINGAVSAAALAGKGVKVGLIDRGDFAGSTSSNSSNLAWGGIKYLENNEYLLVNKLCKSRNNLMRHYPSTVKEIRFLTTISKGFRLPTWFVYLGTLLYWLMGRAQTSMPVYFSSRKIKQRENAINVKNAVAGFEYSDCYLFDNDARFVFNFIRDALDQGAACANYLEASTAEYRDSLWHITATDQMTKTSFPIRAKVLINAGGPFLDNFNQATGIETDHHHAFSKGVHLIVEKIGQNDKVLTFFASDGRLFFVIPMGRKTCIGTTDTPTKNPSPAVTEEDRQFILENVNQLLDLSQPLTRDDIISERCGVRPLAVKGKQEQQEWLQLSRKHVIETDSERAFVSIFGGKLTDCVNVGEEVSDVVADLGIHLPRLNASWYGEPNASERQRFFDFARAQNLDKHTLSFSREPLSERLWRRYELQAFEVAKDILANNDAAQPLIANTEYLRAELKYTAKNEMITTLDDFVRRRSKIAMILSREDIITADGILEACQIFFGDHAQSKLDEYIQQTQPVAAH